MARTSEVLVRSILSAAETDSLSSAQIGAAIDAANVIVNQVSTASCHTTTSLELVERYTAADIAVRTSFGGDVAQEKIGDAQQVKRKSLTKRSEYWETALALDCSGLLGDVGKRSFVFQPFGGAGDW